MHHVVVDRWSQGSSVIHRRDPRVKILATLILLVVIATTSIESPLALAAYAACLFAGLITARLPVVAVAARACIVLPFAGTFAVISALTGDTPRAMELVAKSYLSAAAVLWLVGTTPMPSLMQGLNALGLPRMLVLVVQFVYRYLFVISEQAQHMLLASRCRGEMPRQGRRRGPGLRHRFQAASGAVAVLFGRSYQKAEAIHRAMLARGFQGEIRLLNRLSPGPWDGVYLAVAGGVPVALRIGLGA